MTTDPFAQWEAEEAARRIADADRTEGYAPCSSAACNCGGWHKTEEVNMNKEGINMTMDQLRKVVQWANAQPEAYWLPDPPATPPNVATVIAMYEAVMFMGSSIEEMVAPLPLPWESYNVKERKAINVVRAGLGMEARR